MKNYYWLILYADMESRFYYIMQIFYYIIFNISIEYILQKKEK